MDRIGGPQAGVMWSRPSQVNAKARSQPSMSAPATATPSSTLPRSDGGARTCRDSFQFMAHGAGRITMSSTCFTFAELVWILLSLLSVVFVPANCKQQ